MEHVVDVQIVSETVVDGHALAKQLDRVVGAVAIPNVGHEFCELERVRRMVCQ